MPDCNHKRTRKMSWPDGGTSEVCESCLFTRYIAGVQYTSEWQDHGYKDLRDWYLEAAKVEGKIGVVSIGNKVATFEEHGRYIMTDKGRFSVGKIDDRGWFVADNQNRYLYEDVQFRYGASDPCGYSAFFPTKLVALCELRKWIKEQMS